MAHQSTHFPNSPIVEAIFSISAPCRAGLAESELEAAFRKAVDLARFPEMHKIHKVDVTMRTDTETGKTESEESREWAGVIFESAGKDEVLQFRRDGMSFHRLAPYTAYEEILPEVQKHWAIYSDLAKPKATTRQGLRFINRISLPDAAKLGEIGSYAQITPAFALANEMEPINLLSRVQLREPETDHTALVSFSLADPDAQPLELIFDLDVNCSETFDVKATEIWDRFGQLRTLKNRLFTGSLHENCLDLFK